MPNPTKKSPRLKWLLFIALWVLLTAAFGYLAMEQASQYSALRNDLERINTEIERARAEHEHIHRQMQFIGSDAYIEEQARRRLGMVLPTELIFKNIGQ
jgi:cell division protein FtsB